MAVYQILHGMAYTSSSWVSLKTRYAKNPVLDHRLPDSNIALHRHLKDRISQQTLLEIHWDPRKTHHFLVKNAQPPTNSHHSKSCD